MRSTQPLHSLPCEETHPSCCALLGVQALLRRLEKRIMVPLPSRVARCSMFAGLLAERLAEGVTPDMLAEHTEGYRQVPAGRPGGHAGRGGIMTMRQGVQLVWCLTHAVELLGKSFFA